MLVANPGHTAFSLSNKSKNICRKTNQIDAGTKKSPPTESPGALKTLCVRIARDTDIIKQKVQKTISSHPKLYTLSPTPFHRCSERDAGSADSFSSDMRHFKPITNAPVTSYTSHKNRIIRMPKVRKFEARTRTCDLKIWNKKRSKLITAGLTAPNRISAFCLLSLSKTNPSEESLSDSAPVVSASVIPLPTCGRQLRSRESKNQPQQYTSVRVQIRRYKPTEDAKSSANISSRTRSKRLQQKTESQTGLSKTDTGKITRNTTNRRNNSMLSVGEDMLKDCRVVLRRKARDVSTKVPVRKSARLKNKSI